MMQWCWTSGRTNTEFREVLRKSSFQAQHDCRMLANEFSQSLHKQAEKKIILHRNQQGQKCQKFPDQQENRNWFASPKREFMTLPLDWAVFDNHSRTELPHMSTNRATFRYQPTSAELGVWLPWSTTAGSIGVHTQLDDSNYRTKRQLGWQTQRSCACWHTTKRWPITDNSTRGI